MTRAMTKLPLPTELLLHIFKHCEEYDWPDDPNAEYIAMPSHFPNESDDLTWFCVAPSSKDDICNIRQTCRQFRAASIENFGWLLGHRIFRLTEVGLQDLQDIAKVDGLAPWIRTLTFGAADLSTDTCDTEEIDRLVAYSERGEEMHRQVSSIRQVFEEYRHLSSEEVKQGLQPSLKAFPKLKCLQLVVNDLTEYLVGWLTAEQKEYIVTNFKHDLEFSELDGEVPFDPRNFYYSHYMELDVLQAFDHLGGHIQDLKFSTCDALWVGFIPHALHYALPQTLCTLRMGINWDHFTVQESKLCKDYSGEFFQAIENMSNLQNLALYLTDHDYDVQWANRLFNAPQKTSKLERIDLKEDGLCRRLVSSDSSNNICQSYATFFSKIVV